MSTFEYYSLIIILATLGGAFIPLYVSLKEDLLKRFLSLSAGVIIGYTLFHMLPEFISFKSIDFVEILLITAGFYIPIFINKDRFLSISDSTKHKTINGFTFVSFGIHAFLDGLLMISSRVHLNSDTVFYLILLHRIPVTFSLVTILKSHMKQTSRVIILLTIFTIMTPLGLYVSEISLMDILVKISKELMAITSGILLYIAFYHLIFEHKLLDKKHVQYIFAGFFFGLLTMVMH